MTPAYVIKLDLITQTISLRAQKIDGSALETYGIISIRFLFQDSWEKVWFFEETFLLADTSMEMILGISFLFLNNADVEFTELEKLTWKLYTAAKALSTIN